MTTITLPRAVVEQALEALKYFRDTAICSADTDTANEVIPALEAALAQQAEPVAYTTGHCENHKQKGGCQLHNLQCGWPDCDRKPSAAIAAVEEGK